MKGPRRSALETLKRQRQDGREVHAHARRIAEHPSLAEHLAPAAVEFSERAFKMLRHALERPEVPEYHKSKCRERWRELHKLRRKCFRLALAAGEVAPHHEQGPEQLHALELLYARALEIFDSTTALLNRALDAADAA